MYYIVIKYNIIYYAILYYNLREFVLNSRHPDPRRAWKGGPEP